MAAIGILGGTFDPVHRAHIQVALTALNNLQLDEVRLIPCRQSPTRIAPLASTEHRLAMLNLAVANEANLLVDDRECQRQGVSFSVDTLSELRSEYPDDALFFIVGVDAFNGLLAWHKWSEIFELAHIVVVSRPGEELVTEGELAKVLAERSCHAKPNTQAGNIITGLNCELPQAASQIRAALKAGESIEEFVDKAVHDYIQENRLYQ
ncbi:MAG: nicotinate-nucleotide adenylyltransferase [Sulfuriflexus sp.]|nr:nicotinate-nucleotide adenylyltransferase [Sulfuriflexus sp.]